MAYFPNGTSGDIYLEEWCFRCVNWRENPEHEGNWGCIVWDLHILLDYEAYQCKKDPIAKLYKRVLEHFIPTKPDGLYPDRCRMFIERATADIPGQMKIAWDGEQP